MTTLHLNLIGHGPIDVTVDHLVIAGWTGRDDRASGAQAHLAPTYLRSETARVTLA